MTSVAISFRGATVAVHAPPELCAWLSGFTCPPFTQGGGPPAHPLRVRVEAAARDGWQPDGTRVACFALDEEMVTLPQGRTLDGRTTLYSERHAAMLCDDGADLEVVLAADDKGGRIFCLWLVRELLCAAARAQGDVPLHASGVVAAGAAVVFVGPKGAGKTTLLLHALQQPGARMLANDRIFVAGATAHGVPTIVKLRPGSLALLPRLAARLDARPPLLGPAGLAAHLGVAAVGEAPLARLVFVEPGRAAEGFALHPLGPGEAAARLLDHGLIAGGAQAARFARPTPPLHAAVAALAARVPAASLVLGPDAYRDGRLWAALAPAV